MILYAQNDNFSQNFSSLASLAIIFKSNFNRNIAKTRLNNDFYFNRQHIQWFSTITPPLPLTKSLPAKADKIYKNSIGRKKVVCFH